MNKEVLLALFLVGATSHQLSVADSFAFGADSMVSLMTSSPGVKSSASRMCGGSIATAAFQQNAIKSSNINHAAASGTAMFEINNPGRYYLANTLHPAPVNPDVAVIKINTSNVILDLNSKTIAQLEGNVVNGLTAIYVAPHVSNVTITNGMINHVTGYGIVVDGGFPRANNINICSVAVNDAYANGIRVDNATNIALADVAVTNTGLVAPVLSGTGSSLALSAGAEAFGVVFAGVDNITIDDCSFKNNGSAARGAGVNGGGLALQGVASAQINRTEASINAGDNGYGFLCQACAAVRLTDCAAYSNRVRLSGNSAYGFSFVQSNNVSLIRCEASSQQCNNSAGNTDVSTATAGLSIGFDFNLSNANSLYFCKAFDNKAGGANGVAVGYRFVRSRGTRIISSEAMRNHSDNTNGREVYGFYFSQALGSEVSNSRSCDNVSSNSSVYGFFSSAGRGNTFQKNDAEGNRAGTQLVASACPVAGMCGAGLASLCGSGQVVASGFEFRNGEQGSAIIGCNIISNDGGCNGVGYGIKFGSMASSDIVQQASVRDNFVATNVGNFGMYGMKDFTGLQPGNTGIQGFTSLLINNIFSCNGTEEVLKYSVGGILEDRGLAPCGGQNVYLYFNHPPHEDPANMFIETDISNLSVLSTKPPLGNILFICTDVPTPLPNVACLPSNN